MKLAFACLLLLCNLGILASNYPNEKPLPKLIKANEIPHVKAIIGQYLFMAESEVSNQEYRIYLDWLKKHKPNEYFANYPDTSKWGSTSTYCAPYIQYYFQHPAYKNFPLVNLTQRQALNYCAWLHDSLAKYFEAQNSSIAQFVVRLPTEQEWMHAARGGLPQSAIYPWEGNSHQMTKGKKKHLNKWMLNCKSGNLYSIHYSDQFSFITTQVQSYWPNGYGLYNMSGNVSEWIAETGKTKGGSWNLPAYNARIDVAGFNDGDTSASAETGFRYVIEIISLKDHFIPHKFKASYFKKHLQQVPKMDSAISMLQFAGSTEVSNSEFSTFLLENNRADYQINTQNWSLYFPYKFYEMYGKHSIYGDYPVVNISFQAAQAYCVWLSNTYNALENRAFKKVRIRLPTQKEWEWLAKGGNSNFYYPWGGPYCRNSRGCYLANFCPLQEQYLYKVGHEYFYNYPNNDKSSSRDADGAIIPVHIKSYFPNLIGLYNCSGNAAEMVAEYGISKGGSWNSNNLDIAIKSHETYTEANANTGFRIWMDVLEK